MRPKLKLFLFPLTGPALKNGSIPKKIFQFSVKIFFFKFRFKLREECPLMSSVLSLNEIFLVSIVCVFSSIAYIRTFYN